MVADIFYVITWLQHRSQSVAAVVQNWKEASVIMRKLHRYEVGKENSATYGFVFFCWTKLLIRDIPSNDSFFSKCILRKKETDWYEYPSTLKTRLVCSFIRFQFVATGGKRASNTKTMHFLIVIESKCWSVSWSKQTLDLRPLHNQFSNLHPSCVCIIF